MNNDPHQAPVDPASADTAESLQRATEASPVSGATPAVREIGGRREGLEPTRYGDWEKSGRCVDF